MDIFRAIVKALSTAFLVVAFYVASCVFVVPAYAQYSQPSGGQAQAQCQGDAQYYDSAYNNHAFSCVNITQPNNCYWQLQQSGQSFENYTYPCASGNPCTFPGTSGNLRWNPAWGAPPTSGNQSEPDGEGDGNYVNCPVNFSYPNGTQCVVDSYGYCDIPFSESSGDGSSGSSGAPAPPSNGGPDFNGSNGQPAQPQPDQPPSPVPDVCGGASCYDPNTNQFCGLGAAGQACVPGPVANSSQGGCASAGGSTICAGDPSPPSPVGSSGSTITNPTTQITSTTNYPVENVPGGGMGNVVINTYTGPGGSSGGTPPPGSSATGGTSTGGTSGSSSGSGNSPAGSSSSGNNDSFGGGTDCNTPPVCSGDAVNCGIAREAWQTSCDVTNETVALAGSNPTQQPPTFQSDLTKYSQSDVTAQADSSLSNTEGGQANSGVYNQSGFGYSRTCPITDLTVPVFGSSFVIPLSQSCVIGPWIHALVVGLALYLACVITAGGRS